MYKHFLWLLLVVLLTYILPLIIFSFLQSELCSNDLSISLQTKELLQQIKKGSQWLPFFIITHFCIKVFFRTRRFSVVGYR